MPRKDKGTELKKEKKKIHRKSIWQGGSARDSKGEEKWIKGGQDTMRDAVSEELCEPLYKDKRENHKREGKEEEKGFREKARGGKKQNAQG